MADYVSQLRRAAKHAGFPEGAADALAGHSPRSGAASQAARDGLPPHAINHLAGVKDINWLVSYNRELDSDRLRASWSLGL